MIDFVFQKCRITVLGADNFFSIFKGFILDLHVLGACDQFMTMLRQRQTRFAVGISTFLFDYFWIDQNFDFAAKTAYNQSFLDADLGGCQPSIKGALQSKCEGRVVL